MNIVTGFKFGKIGNIKDFDHIRKFYNYIEADIDSINYEISNSIKEDIKQRFSTGVRFWDLDNIDFTVSNYERWLDN
jgi:tRNA(Ser,Leu) C12 N-acetylase TAN1